MFTIHSWTQYYKKYCLSFLLLNSWINNLEASSPFTFGVIRQTPKVNFLCDCLINDSYCLVHLIMIGRLYIFIAYVYYIYYMFIVSTINLHLLSVSQSLYSIDGSASERPGAFINDSPTVFANCVTKKVSLPDGGVRLCIFARTDISKGMELRYSYEAPDLWWRKNVNIYLFYFFRLWLCIVQLFSSSEFSHCIFFVPILLQTPIDIIS